MALTNERILTLDDFAQVQALLDYEQEERDKHIMQCHAKIIPIMSSPLPEQCHQRFHRAINPQASLQSSLERARMAEASMRLKELRSQYKRRRTLEVQVYLDNYRRQALVRAVLPEDEELYYRQCIAAALEQRRVEACLQDYLEIKRLHDMQNQIETQLFMADQEPTHVANDETGGYNAYRTEQLETLLRHLFSQQEHEQFPAKNEQEEAEDMAEVWKLLCNQKMQQETPRSVFLAPDHDVLLGTEPKVYKEDHSQPSQGLFGQKFDTSNPLDQVFVGQDQAEPKKSKEQVFTRPEKTEAKSPIEEVITKQEKSEEKKPIEQASITQKQAEAKNREEQPSPKYSTESDRPIELEPSKSDAKLEKLLEQVFNKGRVGSDKPLEPKEFVSLEEKQHKPEIPKDVKPKEQVHTKDCSQPVKYIKKVDESKKSTEAAKDNHKPKKHVKETKNHHKHPKEAEKIQQSSNKETNEKPEVNQKKHKVSEKEPEIIEKHQEDEKKHKVDEKALEETHDNKKPEESERPAPEIKKDNEKALDYDVDFPPLQSHVVPLQGLIQRLASEPVLIGEQQTHFSDEPKPSGIWAKRSHIKSPPPPPLSTQTEDKKASFLPQHIFTEAEPTPTLENMPNTPLGQEEDGEEDSQHFVDSVAAEQKNETVPPDPKKTKMVEELELISHQLQNEDSEITKRWKHVLQGGEEGNQQLEFAKQQGGTLVLTATTAFNRQFLGSEDELVRTLIRLDAIDSMGDDSIRKKRKSLVKTCESMLEKLDAYKQSQWEKAVVK